MCSSTHTICDFHGSHSSRSVMFRLAVNWRGITTTPSEACPAKSCTANAVPDTVGVVYCEYSGKGSITIQWKNRWNCACKIRSLVANKKKVSRLDGHVRFDILLAASRLLATIDFRELQKLRKFRKMDVDPYVLHEKRIRISNKKKCIDRFAKLKLFYPPLALRDYLTAPQVFLILTQPIWLALSSVYTSLAEWSKTKR